MTPSPACRLARDDLIDLQYQELEDDDVPIKSFFPLDRIRKCLNAKVKEILACQCTQCQHDLEFFGNQTDPHDYIDKITGGKLGHDDSRQTAFALFALLLYVGHPLFIVGFIHKECSDFLLEKSATQPVLFSREQLRLYTGQYHKKEPKKFGIFAKEFSKALPEFAVPHMDTATFSQYDASAILPFIQEKEIGKRINELGRLTSEGANGRVFAFKIYEEYRRFPHAPTVKDFARKKIETSKPEAFLERSNIQYVQRFQDDHIVRLIKAYGLGESINLIFPLAWTNLDHLLRDPTLKYGEKRGAKIELSSAWDQVLGIAKALRKIQGFGQEADSKNAANISEPLCIHFDLKPDNILVEKDGNWVITDFGQAAQARTNNNGATPRVYGHWGTPAYAPPEIENIQVEAGRSYDIWSLGCIILEVTAFVVLGYAGLQGSTVPGDSFQGLDQVRRASPPWPSRSSDECFFYRTSPQGEYVVKHEIRRFMNFLKTRHVASREVSEQSKAFLAKILYLVDRMLKPNVADRIDSVDVVRTLSAAMKQSSNRSSLGGVSQMIPHRGETILGGPDLNSIDLYHWSEANNEWEGCSLEAFENEAGNLRLHCWATNRPPTDINFRRSDVKLLPLYAFWEPSSAYATRTWIHFLFLSQGIPSVVSNAQLSFDGNAGVDSARVVQSKLTSQHIVASFAVRYVKLKKYVPTAKKGVNTVMRMIGSSRAERKAEDMIEKLEFGSATVQIWIEEADSTAGKRRGSTTTSTIPNRSVRVFQSGYREISPRRVVIYLHQPRFICTIKMDLNWVLGDNDDDPLLVSFKPNNRERQRSFVACWIRPTQEELDAKHPAGIPLSPKALQYYEDLDRFEADHFELRFASMADREGFWSKYMQVKHDWDVQRQDLEKTQGYTPVNRRPDHNTLPDLPGTGPLPIPRNRARFTFGVEPGEMAEVALTPGTPGSSNKSDDISRHDSKVESNGGLSLNLLTVPSGGHPRR